MLHGNRDLNPTGIGLHLPCRSNTHPLINMPPTSTELDQEQEALTKLLRERVSDDLWSNIQLATSGLLSYDATYTTEISSEGTIHHARQA